MRVNKIHQRHHSLRNMSKTRLQDLDKFFETKTYVKNVKTLPMDTPEMREFNEHMQEVQRQFRIRANLSEIEARKMFFNV